jgi:hypothetical protein
MYRIPKFDPDAQYRVICWRGIQAPGRLLEEGEIVPRDLIDDRTLSILLRMNQVAIVEPRQPETEILSDAEPAPIIDADEEIADALPAAPDAAPPKRGRGRPRKAAA